VTALSVSLLTFAIVFGAALLGMSLRGALPEDHLREDVRDVIKLSTGLIGTMAALVLGLLIASAKSTYDSKSTEIKQITANIILLDFDLQRYGPDAQNLRLILRSAIPPIVDRIWKESDHAESSAYSTTVEGYDLVNKIQQLQPNNDLQRALQSQALSTVTSLAQTRVSLFTQSKDAIPTPFLVILIFWLAIIFMSFGLFVRPNRIVTVTFLVSALSVAGSIFLILEMGQPFAGLMRHCCTRLRRLVLNSA
jgi:hypothetical protein